MSQLTNIAKKTLISAAKHGLSLQLKNGAMPAGHNGPRFQTETPVRNTCHWLVLFLCAYRLTKDITFYNAAHHCLLFLLDKSWRSDEGIFHLRDDGKNKSNGLIGQAWVLEALLFCVPFFRKEAHLIKKTAEQTFDSLPFVDAVGLWKIKDTNGEVYGIARTFNQQLWLAYIGLQLSDITGHDRHALKSHRFLNMIEEQDYFSVHPSGLIDHMIYPTYQVYGIVFFAYQLGRKLFEVCRSQRHLFAITQHFFSGYNELCLGYQSFNLTCLAMIQQHYPDLISSALKRKIAKAILFCETDSYYQHFPDDGYGYSYNSIGWEMAYVEHVFQPKPRSISWLKRQLDHYFTEDIQPLNTQDPATLLARVYELYRLFPDLEKTAT